MFAFLLIEYIYLPIKAKIVEVFDQNIIALNCLPNDPKVTQKKAEHIEYLLDTLPVANHQKENYKAIRQSYL